MKQVISSFLLSFILLFVVATSLHAGVGGYTFSASSGTYTPITGSTQLLGTSQDEANSASTPIGFNFVYDGITYTNFVAGANGWMTFNTAITATLSSNALTSNGIMVAPLWDDNQTGPTNGKVHYILTGSPGSQVLTVEWTAMKWNYLASTENANFQVKLYESDSHIEFVYGTFGTANSGTASIGIADMLANSSTLDLSQNHFMSVTPTGAGTATASRLVENAAISASTNLTSGTTYSFTRPATPISSDITVGSGGTYTTLQAALAALRDNGVSAPINVTLLTGFTLAVSDTPRIDYMPGMSATNTVTIRPDAGVALTLTRASAVATTSDYTFRVRGARYLTINGVNAGSSLTLVNTGTAIVTSCLKIMDGAQNNTFTNLTIKSEGSTGATNGTVLFSTPLTINNINIANSNNTVLSCTITKNTNRPMNTVLFAGSTTVLSDACKIQNCTITDWGGASSTNVAAIQGTGGYSNVEISGNDIYYTAINPSSTSTSINGIYMNGTTMSLQIFKNKIHDIAAASAATSPLIRGMRFLAWASSPSTRIYNNFVYLDTATVTNATGTAGGIRGIELGGTGVVGVYFNNVRIGGTPSTTSNNGSTACYYRGGAATDTVMNNVFYMARTSTATATAKHYAIQAPTITGTFVSNNNDLYAPGDSGYVGIYSTTTAKTLSAWQTATGKDYNSVSSNPNFLATSNLHINTASASALEAGAVTANGITTDIDGDTRAIFSSKASGSAPDIGADEFTGTLADVTPPSISYTTLANTASTSNRTVTARIKDGGSGVHRDAASAPRLWFKKFAAGSYQQVTGVESPADSFTFTIDYSLVSGIAANDSIYYYIAAQDSSNITGTSPFGTSGTTNPPNATVATPNNYKILPSLSGTKTIGSGGNYANMKAFFDAINGSVVDGDITGNIISDLSETATATLNAVTYSSGTFLITIQPSGGSWVDSGTIAGALIDLNGADYVTFNGVGKTLQFRNKSTSGQTFVFRNDATNDTVKNCIIEGSNTSTSSGTIVISTSTGTTGNDNILIDNNDIRDRSDVTAVPANAIYSSGTAGVTNSSNKISNNNIYNWTNGGVFVTATGNGDTWNVSNNALYQTASRAASLTAIQLLGGGNDHTVSNNSIGGSSANRSGTPITNSTGFFYGIYVSAGTTTASNIQGNTIANINNAGVTTSYIIYITGGNVNVGTTSANTVGGAANAYDTVRMNYDTYVIRSTSTGIVSISNNLVANIRQTSTGADYLVGLSATAGINTFSNNVVRDLIVNSTSTTIGSALSGLSLTSTTAGQTVSNNQFYNFSSLSTGTSSYPVTGIYISSSSTSITVSKNTVYGITAAGTGTSTSSPQVWGMYIASTGTGTYTNNLVAVGTGSGNETRVKGIEVVSTSSNDFYFNSVSVTGTTSAGTNSSYAFSRTSTSTDTLRDNSFANFRTGGTGNHYAIGVTSGTSFGVGSSNYNNLHSTNSAAIGLWKTFTVSFSAWKDSTLGDANSVSGDPQYTNNATNLHANTTLGGSANTNAGTAISAITTDYDGDTRNVTTPDIGADEFTYAAPSAFTLTSPSGADQGVTGTLTWTAATGASRYDVYFGTDATPTTLVSGNQAGTTYSYSGSSATTYYWEVYAENADSANGSRTKSTNGPLSFTTVTPPASPTGLTLTNVKTDSIFLTWTDNAADGGNTEDSFYVYRAVGTEPNVGTPFTDRIAILGPSAGSGGSVTYQDYGLSPNVYYHYRVSAKNAQGESNYSHAHNATLAVVPGAPTTSTVLYTSMTLTLADPGTNPSVTQYAVQATTPSSKATKYVHTNGTLVDTAVWATYSSFGGASGKNLTGLTIATEYTFSTKARNQENIETAYGSATVTSTLSPIASYPYTQNFESADPTWYSGITVGGMVNNWILGTPAKAQITGAHSGTKSWVTNLTGTYDNNHNAAVYSPLFNFSSFTKDPQILFWHNFYGETGYEAGVLEYTTDNGTSWRRADSTLGTGGTFNTTSSVYWYNSSSTLGTGTTLVNPPKFSGSSTAYTGHSTGYIPSISDLVGLAGKSSVQFRWRWVSDGSVNSSYEGWSFDDVTIAQDLLPPAISYNTLPSSTDLANRTLAAKITDTKTGVARSTSGNPRLWFKKNRNGSYVDASGVEAPADSFTFTIDYSAVAGAVAGDSIFYYVAAQDSSANVGANPLGTNGTANPPNATVASPNIYALLANNDIAAVTLNEPTPNGIKRSNTVFNPKATFQNRGTDNQKTVVAFNVFYQILNNSEVVYEDQKTVASLASGATTLVTFDTTGAISGSTSLGVGTYTVRAISALVGDGVLSNDTLTSTMTVKNPLAGTYTIGGTGNYVNLTSAVADLNNVGASSPVLFSLLADYAANADSGLYPITINPVQYVGGPHNVTIKPATGATISIVGRSAGNAIIKLNGADNITIDGSNGTGKAATRDLTISNLDSSTGTAAIWLASAGTNQGDTNVVIKNTNLSVKFLASTSFAIYAAGTTISSTGTGNSHHSLRVENNRITRSYNGIYVRASSGNNNRGLVITGNIIGSNDTLDVVRLRGINVAFADAPVISYNEIFGMYTRTSAVTLAGIDIFDDVLGGMITNNKIYNIKAISTTAVGAYGIVVSANSANATNVTIAHNLIYDISSDGTTGTTSNPFGIRIFGGVSHKIYYNTVNMNGAFTGTSTTDVSAALVIISSTVTNNDVRNNIFVNSMTTQVGGVAKAYAMYVGSSSITFTNLDHNDYFVSGTSGVLGYYTADKTTLADWRTSSGKDGNSINVNPDFVSGADLHINLSSAGVESRGTPIVGYTTDIDGDTRSATLPDIGADEYSGPTPGAFTLTAPADNAINQGVSGTLSWGASSGGVLYDVYLDQNTSPTTLVSENQRALSYSYSGLTKGFNYYWKVVAKNNSGSPASSITFKFSTYTTPQAFNLVYPTNNATAIPNNGNLRWRTSKDILKNAGVVYDVYLDVVRPPVNLVGTNLTDTMKAYSGLSASTKYYWKVDAKNDLGTLASVTDSFTIENPVAAFNLVTPADAATNVALAGKFIWNKSTYATSYELRYTQNGSFGAEDSVRTITAPETLYNYSRLLPTQLYRWKVIASNSVSTLDAANAPDTFMTVTPPIAPTGLAISNVTNDSMDLSWTDNASDEERFYIHRSLTGVEGSYSVVDSVGFSSGTGGTVVYTGLSSRALGVNIRYHWRVTAHKYIGPENAESDFSGANKATLANIPNETFVDNPNPTTLRVRIASGDGNPTNTEYSIKALSGAVTEGDNLYVQNDTTLGASQVWRTRANWGGISGVTVKGLTPSTNYTFSSNARNLDLIQTAYGTANSQTTKPAAPANLTITNVTSTGLQLNWNDVTPDESGFIILRTTNLESGYTRIDTVNAGEQIFVDAGLAVNTRYYYGVVAYNAIGESFISSRDTTTAANTPLMPTVSDSTYFTFKVTINSADGNPSNTEYAIRVRQGANEFYVQGDGSISASPVWQSYTTWGGATGKTVTGLTIATSYEVDLKARNLALVETGFGPTRTASTAPRPSILLFENFTTFTGAAPPPTNWAEGNDKDILDGGIFGAPSASTWTVDGLGNVGTTGAAKFNFVSTTLNDWDWLVSPVIDMTLPAASSSLYYTIALTGTGTTVPAVFDPNDTLFVVVSTDSGVTFPRSNVVAMYHAGSSVSNTGQIVKLSLAAFSSVTKLRVGFLAKDLLGAGSFEFFVDDVAIIRDFNNDMAGVSIQDPPKNSSLLQNVNIPVRVTFANNGAQPQSDIGVDVAITDSATGENAYSSSRTIASLTSNTTQQVTFDDVSISLPSTYLVTAYANLGNDEFRANDTVRHYFKIVAETRTDLTIDNGGYIYSASTSTASPRPKYGWEEAGPENGGTLVTTGDDEISTALTLPRPFTFYGNTYNSIVASTNGWVTFDVAYVHNASQERTELQIPNTTAPNNIVSALWDDLDTINVGGVYTKTCNNKYIIQWQNFKRFSGGTSDLLNFQIVLDFADNSIAINYASADDGNFVWPGGTAASVGIEGDGAAGNGTSYYFTNVPALNIPVAGTTIKFGTASTHLNNTGSLSGVKYNDLDEDGTRDIGEPGLSGWTMNYSGAATGSVQTDANGYYEIALLPDGNFTVTEVGQAGWQRTQPNTASYSVSLAPGECIQNLNFGAKRLISYIRGTKWDDVNGNGIKETGEPGLQGWEIRASVSGGLAKSRIVNGRKNVAIDGLVMEGKVSSSINVDLIDSTDEDGNYEFADVAPGTYDVSETQQTGWTQTYPGQGGIWTIDITDFGQVSDSVNFGNFKNISISGMKYYDEDRDGQKDEGEEGVSGWSILLEKDGDLIAEDVTDVNGLYAFSDIGPGTYDLSEVLQTGWAVTQPSGGKYSLSLESGENLVDMDFGNYILPSSISGVKYLDANMNGEIDQDEDVLTDWVIVLSKGGDEVGRDTTDEDGAYGFVELLPGNYTVGEVSQIGYTSTNPSSGSYTLSLAADVDTVLNFGNRTTTPGEFIGGVDSLWSNPANWGYGRLPGANDDVVIPPGVRCVMDGFGDSSTIKSLTVNGTLTVTANDELTIKEDISTGGTGKSAVGGSIIVAADASPTFSVEGNWEVESFTPGQSTVSFSGDAEKSVSSTTFYKADASGGALSFEGNVTFTKWLVLNTGASMDVDDTLRVSDVADNALRGTGVVSQGTVVRSIGGSNTNNYRFHGPNSSVAFTSGNPSSVSMTKREDDSIDADLNTVFKEGEVNTVTKSVSVSNISNFSKWSFGQVGHTYEIDETATNKDGVVSTAAFSATLSLEYDPTGVTPSGLYKTANSIVVKNLIDLDRNVGTTGDRTAKAWGLSVTGTSVSASANDSVLTVDDVGLGSFVVAEADSGNQWIRLAQIIDGETTAGTDSVANVTFSGSEGTKTTVIFVNGRLDTTKFRTLKHATELTGKSAKIKFKKGTAKSVPNFANARDSILGRQPKGTLFTVGVPRNDAPKSFAWLTGKKGSDLGKFFTSLHEAGTAKPFDSTGTTKKKKMIKGNKFDRKKINNILAAEQTVLKLNILGSDNGVLLPKGATSTFGDLIYEEVDGNATFNGKTIRYIAGQVDSMLTMYDVKPYADYNALATFLARLNESFYSATLDSNDLISYPDTIKKKVTYELRLRGTKELSEITFLRRGNLKGTPFWLLPGATATVPVEFALGQNYPNPFNPTTMLNIELPDDALVTLKVYDVLGREVATVLQNEELSAGEEAIEFDASRLTSGVYFYRLTAVSLERNVEFTATKKMILMK